MGVRIVRQLEIATEPIALPADGRQSERALAIRRGVCRRLRAEGLALIPEVTLRSGRRADLVALAGDGMITIVEIKSSIEDFRADAKWRDYCLHSDHFYFATGPHVPAEIFPAGSGADRGRPLWRRDPPRFPLRPMSAARRKEMLIRIARAGAHRLHDLEDPSHETRTSHEGLVVGCNSEGRTKHADISAIDVAVQQPLAIGIGPPRRMTGSAARAAQASGDHVRRRCRLFAAHGPERERHACASEGGRAPKPGRPDHRRAWRPHRQDDRRRPPDRVRLRRRRGPVRRRHPVGDGRTQPTARPRTDRLRYRIGIHVGDIIIDGERHLRRRR